MHKRLFRAALFVAFALGMLAACSGAVRLAAPPNLYSEGTNYPDADVPIALRTVAPRLLYVTDRAPEFGADGAVIGYSRARSQSMALGAARVRFGARDWDDLVARTHVDRGGRISRLTLEGVRELVRFDPVPLPTVRADGALRVTQGPRARYAQSTSGFRAAIRAEIARTGRNRVLVFAHGVRNEFDTSLHTLANLWHFGGRRSVPIAFAWPAGNRGLLGYFQDRAAGDFSVFHAKEFLLMLAEMPEVAQIDIVAHSRGTDVMSQALRELIILQRGRGVHPKLGLKTGTLILAAADLDTGIVRQRLLAERFSEAFEQVNVYVNPDDSALRLSSFLTKTPRIGALRENDFSRAEIAQLAKQDLIHFIRVEGANSADSHSYFRTNPAVLSDIVLALRTRAFPGGTLRPLDQDADGVWVLHPNYPLERLPDLDLPLER